LHCRDERAFKEMVECCGLLDVGFEEPKLTWKRGDLQVRLDRVLINQCWRLRFPRAKVSHLFHYKSDHPLLHVFLDVGIPMNQRRRPFRFRAAWLSHDGLASLVRDNWCNNMEWNAHLVEFTKTIKVWNTNVFGNMFWKREEIHSRLRGIDRSLSRGPQ